MQQFNKLKQAWCIFEVYAFVVPGSCKAGNKPCSQQHLKKVWLTLQVTVPSEWIHAIFPGVRQLLQRVQARNARMQSGKGQADDLMSDKAAEGFLHTVLYSGICFWQNLPFRTQR